MALVTCKDCQKEYSSDAKSCPHCGARKPGKTIWQKLGIGFGIYIFAGVVLMKIFGPHSEPEAPKTPEQVQQDRERSIELGTAIVCQKLVKKSLHDPDSAEFDAYSDYEVKKEKGIYTVYVTLRARNGFNALRQMTVKCSLLVSKDNSKLLELKEVN